jgi:malonyl-CoA/methylmalonyl-CoA synthetase
VSSSNPPIVARAQLHGARTAIVDADGSHTYEKLSSASRGVAARLLSGRADLDETRVAFLVSPSFGHVALQWGIWRAGGLAVPLPVASPAPDLEYLIRDSDSAIVVCDSSSEALLGPIANATGATFFTTDQLVTSSAGSAGSAGSGGSGGSAGSAGLAGPAGEHHRREPMREPSIDAGRRAMMVYTSGTTGKPKGVVATHANITAQIESLLAAWEWTRDDRTLLVLPLHHVHGIINVVSCALWSGAVLEIQPRFDPEATWDRLSSGDLTVFTAVPTIYHRLIQSWEAAAPEARRSRSSGCRALRLMMSGSSALPRQVLARWKEISGHVLLERYGMTEVGMAMSNPLHGERRPGYVGSPLPGVAVRLVSDENEPVRAGEAGEVQLKGAGVFSEYWRQPKSTQEAFVDGWFRTGDIAVYDDGAHRLLGRSSVDIIKTGGDKVSALEVEEVLRTHPAIADCAVIGIDDLEWGQRVCAFVETRPSCEVSLTELREWAKSRMAPSKIPRTLLCVPKLPRNAMGKIVKPELATFFAQPAPPERQEL